MLLISNLAYSDIKTCPPETKIKCYASCDTGQLILVCRPTSCFSICGDPNKRIKYINKTPNAENFDVIFNRRLNFRLNFDDDRIPPENAENSYVIANQHLDDMIPPKDVVNIYGINRNLIDMKPLTAKILLDENLKWSKIFNLSELVTIIYTSSDGKIPVAKIVNFLKKSKGSFSKADKESYGEIVFTDLKEEISALSDEDWEVIENSFSNLTKEQIMSGKNEGLLLKNIQDSALTLPSNKKIIEAVPPRE